MTATATTVDVTVTAGPTSRGGVADWELYFARRALAKLKSRLGRERLLELLAPDIETSSKALSGWAAESEGRWRPALTHLRVSGLSATEFLAYFEGIFEQQPKMLAAQPEHFVLGLVDGAMEIVENLGPYLARIELRLTAEDQAVGELLADHPIRMVGNATLADGTVVAHLLHQLRDTANGFDVVLGIYFPQAAPEEVVEGHRQHLAVEFTNWIIGAGESLGRVGDSPVPLLVEGTERYRA
jgi:hypothetical protein